MSWAIHYELPFAAKDGTQYAVRIHEQDYSGSVVRLTGSAEPFITKEAESEDPFEPLRGQTGTISIVADITLLESIMPSNNTEKRVTLHSGTWNGTTFTATATEWEGFLCAEAYTQPLDGQVAVIELPVKSVVAAFEDVSIQPSTTDDTIRLAGIIVDALSALNITAPWDNVVVISDMDPASMWGYFNIARSVWFESDEVVDEGDTYKTFTGKTFADILGAALRLFGLCIREKGTTLYVAQYDEAGTLQTTTYPWYAWATIASSTSATTTLPATTLPESDLMTQAQWRGADNSVTYNPGKRKAKVVLSLDQPSDTVLQEPLTTEDATAPSVLAIGGGTLYVQAHQPRTNSYESYTFTAWRETTYSAASNYGECVAHAAFNYPYYSPYSENNLLYSGAFPVRWNFQSTGQATQKMASALWMVTHQKTSLINPSPWAMYAISSQVPYFFDDGYLRISCILNTLIQLHEYGTTTQDYMLLVNESYSGNVVTQTMKVAVEAGDKIWNPNTKEWGTRGIIDVRNMAFDIEFNGPNIKTNKTDDMNVSASDGYLIPISGVHGVIKFHIFNVCSLSMSALAFDHILRDFRVEYLPTTSLTASSRSENTYMTDIVSAGFREDVEVSLEIGTINNNDRGQQFIRDGYLDYVEQVTFGTSSERPEKHLLSRLAAYYNQTRRVMVTQLATGLDLMGTRYTYAGRTFAGFIKEQNWRNNEQTVQFIEVT